LFTQKGNWMEKQKPSCAPLDKEKGSKKFRGGSGQMSREKSRREEGKEKGALLNQGREKRRAHYPDASGICKDRRFGGKRDKKITELQRGGA